MKKIFFIVLILFIYKMGNSKDKLNLINKVSLEVCGRNYIIRTSILIKSNNKIYNRIPLKLQNYKHDYETVKKIINSFNEEYTASSNFFMFRGWQTLSANFSNTINSLYIIGIEIELHNIEKRNNSAFYIYFDNFFGYNEKSDSQIIHSLDDIEKMTISTEPKSSGELLCDRKIAIRDKESDDKCLGIKLFDMMKVDKILIMFKK